jgi:succinate dehydrogenase hydrophobic anchor subunit
MGKLEVVSNVVKAYLITKNEWFINYKLSLYLFVMSAITFGLYMFVGTYSFYTIFYKVVLILMFGHAVLSVLAVINDYVFNVQLKSWFKVLWLLISFRVLLEVLVW